MSSLFAAVCPKCGRRSLYDWATGEVPKFPVLKWVCEQCSAEMSYSQAVARFGWEPSTWAATRTEVEFDNRFKLWIEVHRGD